MEVRPAAEAGRPGREAGGQEGAEESGAEGRFGPHREDREKPKTDCCRFQIAGHDQEARAEAVRRGLEVIFLINFPASCKMVAPAERLVFMQVAARVGRDGSPLELYSTETVSFP